jgi:hypothetical protein
MDKRFNDFYFSDSDEFDRPGAFRGFGVRRGITIILTCFDGNMPCTVKCIYDLLSYAEGRLHPKYTSGCIHIIDCLLGWSTFTVPF